MEYAQFIKVSIRKDAVPSKDSHFIDGKPNLTNTSGENHLLPTLDGTIVPFTPYPS